MNANKTHKSDDEEATRQLIRNAFPLVRDRKDLCPLSHEEAVHMRSRLSSLTNEDLPFYMGQVLTDLLDTHTGKAGESEDAEAVIQHLNVLVGGSDVETIRGHLGPSAAAQALGEETYLRSRLAQAYASFTPQQALAICKWLTLARAWVDLKWYQDELDAALLYWEHRVAGNAAAQRGGAGSRTCP